MKAGVHQQTLAESAQVADTAIWANLSGLAWLTGAVKVPGQHCGETMEVLQNHVVEAVKSIVPKARKLI